MRKFERSSQGLSMIELLVALALSSFLILGITQVYINNKSNYLFQQNQANNMENGRFIQLVLNEQIGKAGYRRAPDQNIDDAFKPLAAVAGCAAFPSEGAITRLSDTDEKGFCMRYQPAINGEQACDGVGLSLDNASAFIPAQQSEMAYAVIRHEWDNNLHLGRVTCNGVDLIEGVADLNVDFLLGERFERRFQDNPYQEASSYNTSDVVRGVRYSVLLASRPNQRSGVESTVFTNWEADEETRTLLNENDNNRIYQVVTSTQVLRNLVP